MATYEPRESPDAPSTSVGTTDAEVRPQIDRREVAPNARWNWWILNHGLLIGGTLIGVALLTLGLRFISDQRGQRRPSSTNTARQTSTTGGGLSSVSANATTPTSPVTTVSNQVLAKTVAPPVATTVPSTIPSSAAANTQAAPATSAPRPASEPTTSTTQAATTAPAATTTTETPAPVSQAAKQLPHLQLGKIPTTWVQVSRRMTSRPTGGATEPALSFRWVGPQGDTSILLQIASATVPVASGVAQTVRGHSAVAIRNANGTTLQWLESPGTAVGVTVHGFSESDALTFANNIVRVGDAEWARLIDRAELVNPPDWNQVLTADW